MKPSFFKFSFATVQTVSLRASGITTKRFPLDHKTKENSNRNQMYILFTNK
jgi:hypothetical protein